MSWGPFDLTGRVAIVTGGAMGIGRGIVRRFVEAGANVLVVDLDEAALHATCAALPKGWAAPLTCDIAADGAGELMVKRCVNAFGKLDVLVNNAGIYPSMPFLKMPVDTLDRVLRINLRALMLASKAAGLRFIEQQSGGRIINISSVDAYHPSMVGLAAYDASKGAVNMFTRSFALEMAPHRVLVNGIAPGGVATEGTAKPLEGSGMTADQMKQMMEGFIKTKIPLGRMGAPDDIATAAVFLASSAAGYITGTTLVVDGGMLLS
jgi:2-deoxy-D-gluconate 3-dehydrogenase